MHMRRQRDSFKVEFRESALLGYRDSAWTLATCSREFARSPVSFNNAYMQDGQCLLKLTLEMTNYFANK